MGKLVNRVTVLNFNRLPRWSSTAWARVVGAAGLALAVVSSHAARATEPFRGFCQTELSDADRTRRNDALNRLHPLLKDLTDEDDQLRGQPWFDVFEKFILKGIGRSPVLTITYAGAGSGWKSALFSSHEAHYTTKMQLRAKAEDRISPSDDRVGETKQAIIMIGDDADTAWIEEIKETFGDKDMKDWTPGSHRTSGSGVLFKTPHLPGHQAVVDTPGFGVDEVDETRAGQVVQRSNVLILPGTFTTLGVKFIKETLRDSFKAYGPRPVIFVVTNVVNASAERKAKASKLVLDAANAIFGTNDTTLPKMVLGAYIMEVNGDAENGEGHGTYIPLRKNEQETFMPFGDLLRMLAQHSGEVKDLGVSGSIPATVDNAIAHVQDRLQRRWATRVYRAALLSGIRDATTNREAAANQDALVDPNATLARKDNFPVEPYIEIIRAALKKDKGLVGAIEKYHDYAFTKVTEVYAWAKHLRHKPEPAQRMGVAEMIAYAMASKTMARVLRPFGTTPGTPHAVPYSPHSKLAVMARTYDQRFNPSSKATVLEGELVQLPPFDDLFKSDVDTIRRLQSSEQALVAELQKVILSSVAMAFDQRTNPARIYEERRTLGQVIETTAKAVGGPALIIASFFSGTIMLAVPAAVIVTVAGNLAWIPIERMLLRKRTIKRLNTYVNAKIIAFLRERTTLLRDSLKDHSQLDPRFQALQDELQILKPSYQPVPLK